MDDLAMNISSPLPAAPSETHVVPRAKPRVAQTAIPMNVPLLESRKVVPTTPQLILTTACHRVARTALHVVAVALARVLCVAVKPPIAWRLAPSHVAVELATAEAHVAAPSSAADWERCLECGVLVPVAIVVVDTTTSGNVASGQGSCCCPPAMLESRTSDATIAVQATAAGVAGDVSRAESCVASPVRASGVTLLERREFVEMPITVIDATTDHCVPAWLLGKDDTSMIGGCCCGPACQSMPTNPTVVVNPSVAAA